MELYAAAGMEIVSQLGSFGKNVFLDLKLYDIAETVKRATRQICQNGASGFFDRARQPSHYASRGGRPRRKQDETAGRYGSDQF